MEEQSNEMSQEEIDMRSELAEEVFNGAEPVVYGDDVELEQSTDIEPEPEAAADPWEGVSPVVRERIEALSGSASKIEEYERRLKQAEKRVGSLQNTFQNKPAVKLTAEQQAKIDAFKEDFGDIYEVVDLLTASNAGGTTATIDSEVLNQLRAEIEATKKATSTEIETFQLRLKHPDYTDTIKSKDWQKWLIDQEPEVRNKINSPRAVDAIDVLDRYKRDTGQLKSAASIAESRRKKLKSSTQTVAGRKASIPKAEADMTLAEIRAQEAKRIWG